MGIHTFWREQCETGGCVLEGAIGEVESILLGVA